MKVAKTSVKVPACCRRRRWSETWSWRKCTRWSKPLSEGEGRGKRATPGRSGQICGLLNAIESANEASTSTHALIIEARGMSSVRACMVSVSEVEEGKSHRKMSIPLDMMEVWLFGQPKSGIILKRLPMYGRGRKTSAKSWKRYGGCGATGTMGASGVGRVGGWIVGRRWVEVECWTGVSREAKCLGEVKVSIKSG